MKGERCRGVTLEGIHRPEAASGDIQISSAVVVEVEVGVELFAGEEVIVGGGRSERCAGADQVAEGVVVVGVGDGAGWAGQGTDAAVAVVGVVDFLRGALEVGDVAARLADQFEAVEVAVVQLVVTGAAAVERLVDNLRIAGGVQAVHQIRGRDAGDCFADAVAVAVVDDGHSGFLDEVVLEVVDVGDAAGTNCVPIRIVGVAGREPVVGVVVPKACGNGRERRSDLLAVADRVVTIRKGGHSRNQA